MEARYSTLENDMSWIDALAALELLDAAEQLMEEMEMLDAISSQLAMLNGMMDLPMLIAAKVMENSRNGYAKGQGVSIDVDLDSPVEVDVLDKFLQQGDALARKNDEVYAAIDKRNAELGQYSPVIARRRAEVEMMLDESPFGRYRAATAARLQKELEKKAEIQQNPNWLGGLNEEIYRLNDEAAKALGEPSPVIVKSRADVEASLDAADIAKVEAKAAAFKEQRSAAAAALEPVLQKRLGLFSPATRRNDDSDATEVISLDSPSLGRMSI